MTLIENFILRYVIHGFPGKKPENFIAFRIQKFKREENGADLTLHLQKVLFLILIGCEDDLMTEEPQFIKKAHACNLVEKLGNVTPPPDIKSLVRYTIGKLESTARSLLHIVTEDVKMESPVEDKSVEDQVRKKRRAEAAASHRAKVMAQMNKLQLSFASKNAQDLSKMEAEKEGQSKSPQAQRVESSKLIAVGPNRAPHLATNEKHVCILCQEEQSVSGSTDEDGDCLVLACYVVKSTVMSNSSFPGKTCNKMYAKESFDCVPTVTTCGHAMHAKCFQKFYDSLIRNERAK